MFSKKQTIELAVEGMTCGHCSQAVEQALSDVQGVKRVEVALEDGRAKVTAKASTTTSALVDAVENAGYQASKMQG